MSKKIKWILIIVFVVFLIDYILQYRRFLPYNQTPLLIETPDGTAQPYHPSVMYFPEGWNGYTYWMAETPYPLGKNGSWEGLAPYRERWENPCIHASNDGIHWITPSGLENPIDNLSPEEIAAKDYYSDPHLVLNHDTLECWYRISNHKQEEAKVSILRKYSTDGIHWSPREVLIDLKDSSVLSTTGPMIISPAIIRKDQNYHMWYVDSDQKQRKLYYSISSDGRKWNKKIQCQLSNTNVIPWHIDVQYIDSLYHLIVYDWKNLTLWKSEDGLHFKYIKPILNPAPLVGAFYSSGLYRSALLKDHDEFKLYFSAFDKKTQLGLMRGPSPEELTIYAVTGKQKNIGSFFTTYLRIRKYDLTHFFHKN